MGQAGSFGLPARAGQGCGSVDLRRASRPRAPAVRLASAHGSEVGCRDGHVFRPSARHVPVRPRRPGGQPVTAPRKKPTQTLPRRHDRAGTALLRRRRARLRGQRFLSREAPSLPLERLRAHAMCTAATSTTRTGAQGPRRARDMGVAIDGWTTTPTSGPQSKRGRRKADKATAEIGDAHLCRSAHRRASPISDCRIARRTDSLRRSSPNVDIGPCPGTKRTSSPSVNSFSRIERISVS